MDKAGAGKKVSWLQWRLWLLCW